VEVVWEIILTVLKAFVSEYQAMAWGETLTLILMFCHAAYCPEGFRFFSL
jgi:hypothetical protein